MKKLTPYDIRQLKIMEKKITLFKKSGLNLYELISDLQGLLNVLSSIEESWKNDLQAILNNLEMIWDSTIDGSISRWKEPPEKVLDQSILRMQNMILLRLEEYMLISDPNILETAQVIDTNLLMCPFCNDVWNPIAYTKAMLICPKCSAPLHNPRMAGQVIQKQAEDM